MNTYLISFVVLETGEAKLRQNSLPLLKVAGESKLELGEKRRSKMG